MCSSDIDQDRAHVLEVQKRIGEAAESGNEFDLQTLLVYWKYNDFDQHKLDEIGYGLNQCLLAAAGANQPDSVRYLLRFGAQDTTDVAEIALEGNAPVDMWQVLLDHGWNINHSDYGSDPVIFKFLFDESIHPLLPWFLSNGASLLTYSPQTGLNALSKCAICGPLPVLRYLLEYTDQETIARSDALHRAASSRLEDRTAAIMLLVDDFGVDVNAMSTYRRVHHRFTRINARPLHFAIRSGRSEHIRVLLERGARVEEKDGEGRDVREYARSYRPGILAVIENWFAEKGITMPESVESDPQEQK